MRLQNIIKQSAASFLLLVFILSATPKRFLHDVIANHQHQAHYNKNNHQAAVTVAGFNCQIDNLVVDIPFDVVETLQFAFHKQFFSTYTQSLYQYSFTAQHVIIALRGPPAC